MSASDNPTTSASAATTGQGEGHLSSPAVATTLGARVHRDVVGPLGELRRAAAAERFDLRIASAFRSFDQQLTIWNEKATGRRAVLDGNAVPIDIARLSESELVWAILRWSALPGASRHHWGTDVDVYDGAAQPAGYDVQLIPDEVEAGGMFAPLHEWLDARIAAGAAFGFFRPYDRDRGGVAPERWHLSHAPTAARYERLTTPTLLRAALEPADLRLKRAVLDHLDEIVERFVVNTNRARP